MYNVKCSNVILFYFKVMMDVLDLQVSMEEIHTLNDDLRTVWNKEGVICTVPKCPNHDYNFKNLRSFKTHLSKVHVSLKKLYKSSNCKKKRSKPNVRRNLNSSMLRKSNLPLSQSQIKTLSINNDLSHRSFPSQIKKLN